MIRNLLLLTAVALTGCSPVKAQDPALTDAQNRIKTADKVIVITPSKDSWFAKNISDLPQGKEVAVKVRPREDQEFIIVTKGDDTVVILPIVDGKCSVVTEKKTVDSYKARVDGGGSEQASANESKSKDDKPTSWKIKGKTITVGMNRDEVMKLLGKPVREEEGVSMEYKDSAAHDVGKEVKSGLFSFVPGAGGAIGDYSSDGVLKAGTIWVLKFSGGTVISASKTNYQ